MRMLAQPQSWRRVQLTAVRQQETMRRVMLRLFTPALPRLEEAIATQRISIVLQAVAADLVRPTEIALRDTRHTLYTCLVDAGKVTASMGLTLRTAEKVKSRAHLAFAFDETSAEAIAWTQKHAAALITAISEDQREAVRKIITSAFTENRPPRVIARAIHDVVGLTGPQTAKYQSLLATDLKAASKYAVKARKYRAMVIARTETLRASNEGQSQAWSQAKGEGLLTGLELREWIVTYDDRTCPICVPMEGQLRGLNEPFTLPDGTQVMSPPAHPSCRCAQGISAQMRKQAA